MILALFWLSYGGTHLSSSVYALYNQSTKIKYTLLAVLVAGNSVMLGGIIKAVPSMAFDSRCIVVSTSQAMIACGYVSFPLSIPSEPHIDYFYDRLSPLIIDVILLGLTLAKSIPSAYRGRKSLLNVVVQDGAWAFIAVFSTYKPPFLGGSKLTIMCSHLCSERHLLPRRPRSPISRTLRVVIYRLRNCRLTPRH